MSTDKAREVLGAGQHRIIEEHDARKERFDEQAVWDLAKRFHSLVIAKGKTYIEIEPNEESRESILKEVMGRSGNLRAPSLVIGDKLVVGYNEAMYKEFFG